MLLKIIVFILFISILCLLKFFILKKQFPWYISVGILVAIFAAIQIEYRFSVNLKFVRAMLYGCLAIAWIPIHFNKKQV